MKDVNGLNSVLAEYLETFENVSWGNITPKNSVIRDCQYIFVDAEGDLVIHLAPPKNLGTQIVKVVVYEIDNKTYTQLSRTQ